jgi:hypothetical protein
VSKRGVDWCVSVLATVITVPEWVGACFFLNTTCFSLFYFCLSSHIRHFTFCFKVRRMGSYRRAHCSISRPLKTYAIVRSQINSNVLEIWAPNQISSLKLNITLLRLTLGGSRRHIAIYVSWDLWCYPLNHFGTWLDTQWSFFLKKYQTYDLLVLLKKFKGLNKWWHKDHCFIAPRCEKEKIITNAPPPPLCG